MVVRGRRVVSQDSGFRIRAGSFSLDPPPTCGGSDPQSLLGRSSQAYPSESDSPPLALKQDYRGGDPTFLLKRMGVEARERKARERGPIVPSGLH